MSSIGSPHLKFGMYRPNLFERRLLDPTVNDLVGLLKDPEVIEENYSNDDIAKMGQQRRLTRKFPQGIVPGSAIPDDIARGQPQKEEVAALKRWMASDEFKRSEAGEQHTESLQKFSDSEDQSSIDEHTESDTDAETFTKKDSNKSSRQKRTDARNASKELQKSGNTWNDHQQRMHRSDSPHRNQKYDMEGDYYAIWAPWGLPGKKGTVDEGLYRFDYVDKNGFRSTKKGVLIPKSERNEKLKDFTKRPRSGEKARVKRPD